MSAYQIENRDRYSAWKNGGVWILGNRKDSILTKLDIRSSNHGESFYGTVTYKGEEAKEFKARLDKDNMYRTEIKEETKLSSWKSDGIWIIGNRLRQRCTKLNISSDNGKFLFGIIKYDEEEELELKGDYVQSHLVENHWGKENASWHFGGIWCLNSANKKVDFIDIDSNDSGNSFNGSIQFVGEEMLDFKAERIVGNNYMVYCKNIRSVDSWYRCQDMIIGGRDNQRVIKLKFNSNNNGYKLNGIMAYEQESIIKFRADLIEDKFEKSEN
ncbi:MAG: hypothetical protein E7213_06355 [Clostridium sp.]|jgi:hypothetical protein|nr:hypothetical protein [Clostridium sp.]